ncbi:MAG: hypothetical protein HY268_27010 [Deltaproteobacteria bacterium]|nr:hypothetical protein [Deltaproteobacteria bacterium]
MVLQLPLLAAVPSGVLDMTADFTPLLVSLWMVVGLGVLSLALAIGLHDTEEAARTARQVAEPEASFRRAA